MERPGLSHQAFGAASPMGDIIFTLLLAVLLIIEVAFFVLYRRERRKVAQLREECAAIEGEEHRMFDFLHVLGAELQVDSSAENLHSIIVKGSTQVVSSDGGALYLLDRAGKQLIPTYLSEKCPPLIALPRHVAAQAEKNRDALYSYQRLHSVSPSKGIFQKCLSQKKAVRFEDLGQEYPESEIHRGSHALISPLIFGGKALGILAVVSEAQSVAFTENDFDVFSSVAEQSAIALGQSIIQREAMEKKRLENDLKVASEIQRVLLPDRSPDIEGFNVQGINVPAQYVSGDYFDYIPLPAENKIGIAIADVSGKGIPASLIMSICRSVLRSKSQDFSTPGSVLHAVNEQIYPDIKEDMFISLAYLILDGKKSQFTLARAGHDAPLLYRSKTQELERLETPGMALGIDRGQVFRRVTIDRTFTMEKGDCLLLYTDGVTEALDQAGMEFGIEQLSEIFEKSAPQGASEVVHTLIESLKKFVGDHPQYDDITLIAIEKT